MHYVDEGCGRPTVLLHGEPTWSWLWRGVIIPLTALGRVVACDHMGFGKSESPVDRSYRLPDHVANLETLLVEELDLRDITLVVHDWGGPIGAGFALRHPERIARIVVVNAPFLLGLPHELDAVRANAQDSDWFAWARAQHAGDGLAAAFAQPRFAVAGLMAALQGLGKSTTVDATWVRAYGEPFVGDGEARGAIDFPRQLVAPEEFDWSDAVSPSPGVVEALRRLPAICVYGMRDRALRPQHFINMFAQTFPGAPITRLPEAGHFAPQDEPARIAELIAQFVTLTPLRD